MPTVELRRSNKGHVVALRIKVRKAGQPHLSKTFAVPDQGATALKDAERAASAWLAQLEAGHATAEVREGLSAQWHLATKKEPERSRRDIRQDHVEPLSTQWTAAPASLAAADRALSIADEPATRALLQFMLSTGQPSAVAERLRWQQVDLAQRRFAVLGLNGQLLRMVPLPAQALDAMMAMQRRKYGLVFAPGYPAIEAAARKALAQAGLDEAAVLRIAAGQLLAEAVPMDALAAMMGRNDLRELVSAPHKRPLRRSA